jgi:hypothetical protein
MRVVNAVREVIRLSCSCGSCSCGRVAPGITPWSSHRSVLPRVKRCFWFFMGAMGSRVLLRVTRCFWFFMGAMGSRVFLETIGVSLHAAIFAAPEPMKIYEAAPR